MVPNRSRAPPYATRKPPIVAERAAVSALKTESVVSVVTADGDGIDGATLILYRGDVVLRERALDGRKVIEGRGERERRQRLRNTGRIGKAECRDTGPCPNEKGVRVAVIASVELEDDVAFRDGAGDANGAHRRLRPARNEAQHLDVRHAIDDQFRQPHLQLGWNTEAGTAAHGVLERVENDARRVTENERSP